MSQSDEEAARGLTGADARFEVVPETIGDRPMKAFENRERSLRGKGAVPFDTKHLG
jgi:hypothetical protein